MPDVIDVYLLAGQSNMVGKGRADQLPEVLRVPHRTAKLFDHRLEENASTPQAQWQPLQPVQGGFGPELSFGHTVAARHDTPIAILKIARGGTGLFNDWRPLDRDDPAALTTQCVQHARQAFEQLRTQGLAPRLRGIVWYQGERDTRDTNPMPERYGEMLGTLMSAFSSTLAQGRKVPVVVYRVHPHDDKPHPHAESIRRQQVQWAQADPAAAWINVDDLHYPDRLHLDSGSLLAAGDRAAAAMLDLQAASTPAPPPPPHATSTPAPSPPSQPNLNAEPHSQPESQPEPQPEPDPTPPPQAPPTTSPASIPTPTPPAPTPPAAPAPRPDGPRIIALINQKGGVGKTTTAVNIGAALASEAGGAHRVLLIDLDPQAHLSLSLGLDPEQTPTTVYDVLADDAGAAQAIYHVKENPRLAVLPAETNLAGIEPELTPQVMTGRAQVKLRDALKDLLDAFDVVLIDCPPALNLLTINALTLAREVIVPMQAHFLALQGMTKLFETIQMVRQGFNPRLKVSGVVLCMHEAQTLLAGEVIREVEGFFEAARGTDSPWADARLYLPPVRRNIKLAEAPSFGSSVLAYAPDSNGAADYLALAAAVTGNKASPPTQP